MTYTRFSISLVSLSLLALSAQGKHSSKMDAKSIMPVTVEHSKQYTKSLEKYKVCNLNDLGMKLASGNNLHKTSFPTRHIKDTVAEYDFYAVSEPSNLNADRIRHVTCQHIMENQCRVFWGNVLSIAYIAEKPAAAFPGDTTPHYMLSPKITCDKMDFEKIKKEATSTKKMSSSSKKEFSIAGFKFSL